MREGLSPALAAECGAEAHSVHSLRLSAFFDDHTSDLSQAVPDRHHVDQRISLSTGIGWAATWASKL